jgi:outer membrane lipoprotein SlyB
MNAVSTWRGAVVVAALLAIPPAFGQAQAPAPAAAPAASSAAAKCADCGVVQSVSFVEQQGKPSGLGAVAGGVVGGVIGHQIGGGTGKTVATIAGAGGGAYVGHQVEKSQKKEAYWAVTLRMDDGKQRTFHYTTQPVVREGERVKLVDGGKRLALIAN